VITSTVERMAYKLKANPMPHVERGRLGGTQRAKNRTPNEIATWGAMGAAARKRVGNRFTARKKLGQMSLPMEGIDLKAS
jgi:hypothetical protein